MKALVIGSTGLLGSYLGFALPRKGWELVGVSRRPNQAYSVNNVVNSIDEIGDVIRGIDCDVVVNCIALTSHEVCERDPKLADYVNSVAPGSWAAVANLRALPFVHFSTDSVFEGEVGLPYSEESKPQSRGAYGRSKAAGEASVLGSHAGALVLRTNFFGWSPSGEAGPLDFFTRSFIAGTQITGFTDYRVASLYVGDLTGVMLDLVDAHASGTFHAVASDTLSKYDFGLAVGREFGLETSAMSAGSLADATDLAPRGKHLLLTTDKAAATVGYPMKTSTEGLAAAHSEMDAVLQHLGRKPIR
jgi:dTDP-4-dehydrorhamnose reductase